MLQDYLRLVSNSILIIGPAKSGKTTMLRRLQSGDFVEQVKPTLGFDDGFKKSSIRTAGTNLTRAERPFWPSHINISDKACYVTLLVLRG